MKRLEDDVASGLLPENKNRLPVYGCSSDVTPAEIWKRRVFSFFRLKSKENDKLKGDKKERRWLIFWWRRAGGDDWERSERERDVYEDIRCETTEVEDISQAQTR